MYVQLRILFYCLFIFLDLTYVYVQSAEEAYKVMTFGRNNLKIASNNLNKSSSRSHCIFTIKLMRVDNVENPKTAVISRYTFDLLRKYFQHKIYSTYKILFLVFRFVIWRVLSDLKKQ